METPVVTNTNPLDRNLIINTAIGATLGFIIGAGLKFAFGKAKAKAQDMQRKQSVSEAV